MSSRAHDLVPPLAAHEPAVIVPASPPRRAPVDDAHADASFTRKRPRLDSGSTSLRAMSADPDSPPRTAAPPHDQPVEMTLRPHPPSSPPPPADEQERTANAPRHVGLPAHGQSPIVIDSSDGDSASPPVMVIEDDEPDGFTVQLDADDYFRRFPFARPGSYASTVRELAQHIQTCRAPPSSQRPWCIPANQA